MKNVLPLSENDFGLFQKFLVEESGLYFDKDRSDSLHLALCERLQKRKYDTYQEYYNLLKFHPEGRLEMRELLDLITIGETYFFRNLPQFDALMKFVLPEIIQRKMYSPDKSIRVWSAGCSKGDEAHSIAIAIMDVLPSYESWDISILGTDVNRDALVAAKEAIYNRKDIGHLPKEYLDRYFEKRGTNYILDSKVRKLARFEYHNLAKDPFTLKGVQDLDILFCRNVTIYFDFQTTKRVIENFYNSLRRDGYLFLGHAETLWQITNKFETVEFPQTFVYKKALYEVEEAAMRPFMGVPEIELEVDYRPQTIDYRAEGTEKQEAKKQEAERQEAENVRDCFAKAVILANQVKYKDAVDALMKIIETDNLYIEAYYLLGVLAYKTGDLENAEAQFRKVVYVDPEIVLAYFNLGNIYLYQRNFAKAGREFNNAIRLLEKRRKDEQVKFGEDFTADFLLRACKNNLEEINKRS